MSSRSCKMRPQPPLDYTIPTFYFEKKKSFRFLRNENQVTAFCSQAFDAQAKVNS